MKKLLASASFIVLSSATVFAADLPMNYKSHAPYMAPVFNWTGCYVGVHGGGGAMRDSFTDQTGTGGLAGGQLGCNYQDGNWVFGAEGEGYWSGIKATSASSVNSEGVRDTVDTKNKYDFSIAARAGIAFDRTLVYGKAGWVWGQFDFLSSDTNFNGVGVPPTIRTSSASGTLDGLLLGVGIEHAITNNWTVKLEYNFLKYGSKELSFTNCQSNAIPTCFAAGGTDTVRADKQIFKIGANYLFNMGGMPLVAKY
jgi:outer membrane immunogenic protein